MIPAAAQVAYVSDIPFDKPGPWEFAALIKTGGSFQYSLLPSPNPVGDYPMPQVGQRPPAIQTLTAGEVSDISQIDTRIPPDDMHSDDFANVLGKKPVVLLFATPALCQSRVCGPVTDIAEQVKQRVRRQGRLHPSGDLQQQPHQRRTSAADGRLPSEDRAWVYVIDRTGTVSTVLQGPFSVQELQAAVQKVAG